MHTFVKVAFFALAAPSLLAWPSLAQDVPPAAPKIDEPPPIDSPPAPAPVDAPPADAPPTDAAPAGAQPHVDAPPPAAASPAESATATLAPTDGPVQVGYKDGFFVQTADEMSKLRIGGLLQPRFTYEGPGEDIANETLSLGVQRAQVEFRGNVFSRALTFWIKLELGQGGSFVKDASVDYQFFSGFNLRVGQWKRPFNRQELSSDARIAFVDRSITNVFFKGGRDAGVALHSEIEKSPKLEWAVGLFAGAGDKPTIVGDIVLDPATGESTFTNGKATNAVKVITPTFCGRLGYNFGDVKGQSEIDLDGTGLRFGVAGSILEGVKITDAQTGVTRAVLDGIVKLYGFDASGALFVSSTQTGEHAFDQEYEALGARAQIGYNILGWIHPGVRYDYVGVDGADNDMHEIVIGNTLLFFDQNFQWQNDASLLLNESPAATLTTWRLRSQVVLAF